MGSSRERELSASATKVSNSADVSIHETKLKSVETKIDSIDHKVDRLSQQMSMILQRLPADANEKRKSEGLSRDIPLSPPIQQSNLQAVQGFEMGLLNQMVSSPWQKPRNSVLLFKSSWKLQLATHFLRLQS